MLFRSIRLKLGDELCRFLGDKKLVIGICNGFQVLVKAGILPGTLSAAEKAAHDHNQKATLFNNDSGKFEDRWIHLKIGGKSVWTEGIKEIIYLPVAHGEGKFMTLDKDVLEKLKRNGQVVFRYCAKNGAPAAYPSNPNGSVEDIAGITDRTGRILGLMPHPERHFLSKQHPFWTRSDKKEKFGDGAKIFENGVAYARKNL